ncbi:MAG: hypothetical protein J3Q66DRAFT_402178 [Benniella sp.]|nr:MAG: hypothetical protein J3Q66DRAFT_402178 [Benniella sp.]
MVMEEGDNVPFEVPKVSILVLVLKPRPNRQISHRIDNQSDMFINPAHVRIQKPYSASTMHLGVDFHSALQVKEINREVYLFSLTPRYPYPAERRARRLEEFHPLGMDLRQWISFDTTKLRNGLKENDIVNRQSTDTDTGNRETVKNDSEHVNIRAFTRMFNYTDRSIAEQAFQQLLNCTTIGKSHTKRFLFNFQTFNADAAEVFWKQRSNVQTDESNTSQLGVGRKRRARSDVRQDSGLKLDC